MRVPSFPTAISLLALFISLGGTSYAVTALDDNSVTTTKIRNGAVTTPKLATAAVDGTKVKLGSIDGSHLKSGAVKASNIFEGSVDSARIKDGSIGIADLKLNAFGDLTTRMDPNATATSPRIETILFTQALPTDRWSLVDSFKLAAGTHLAVSTADVLIGKANSNQFAHLICSMSRGVPGAAGSTQFDTQRIEVSSDDFVQERLMLVSPVQASSTVQLGMYCKLVYERTDTYAALIRAPCWNAIQVTGSHAPPP